MKIVKIILNYRIRIQNKFPLENFLGNVKENL